MLYRIRSVLLLVLLIGALIATALVAPRVDIRSIELLLPLMTLLALGLAFTTRLQRLSRGTLQYCELGFVFGTIVLLYGSYPLVSFLVRGQNFTNLGDLRLYLAQPSSFDIALIGWYYAIFFASFAVAYLVTRANANRRSVEIVAPGIEVIVAVVLLILLVQAFFFAVQVFFGAADIEGYSGQYLAYLHLPQIVRQVANHLDGAILTLNLLLLSALMARWKQASAWVLGWLVIEGMLALFLPGSRTRLFLLLVGFAINYHYLVRPLGLRTILSGALLGLVFFLVLGALRAGVTGDSDGAGRFLASGTEFESLFVNAFDLERLRANGIKMDILPALYLGDLMRLVPQQLLPWDKLDLANWYVGTFYPDYAKLGGGLAFGVIAEAVVGLGTADLIWRGLAVGVIFGMVQRYFANGQISFRRFVLYLWIVLLSYQTLRNTTFTLLPLFVYQFLPVIIAVEVLSRVLRAAITARAR